MVEFVSHPLTFNQKICIYIYIKIDSLFLTDANVIAQFVLQRSENKIIIVSLFHLLKYLIMYNDFINYIKNIHLISDYVLQFVVNIGYIFLKVNTSKVQEIRRCLAKWCCMSLMFASQLSSTFCINFFCNFSVN